MNNNPFLRYNRKDDLLYSLDLISKNSFYPADRYEVIVVDNNSSDDTYDEVLKWFPNFRVIKLKKNVGLAVWNEGIKKGKGDYFLLSDDYSHPEYSSIKDAVRYMEENKDIGIIACNILGGPFTISNVEDNKDSIGFINCGIIISRRVIEKIDYQKE